MEAISNEDIQNRLSTRFPGAWIEVNGDGYKYRVTVISKLFAGMSKVKRHQNIYAALNDAIASGALHALSIQALTPEENETER
ncbi:MAG TPA: BolA/IbaG family iron-sulfur metabolism protein [Gammaproteobacteria bacterium]